MAAWIFQGNPEKFDIEGYLQAEVETITWLVRQNASNIAIGDTAYIWRSAGKEKGSSGIVAECRVASQVALMPPDIASQKFWRERAPQTEARVALIVLRIATARQVLKRDWLTVDPILKDCLLLRQAQGTNFSLSDEQATRLMMLWNRTGFDWTWREAVAALWAFDMTKGGQVSKLPGSPIAQVALATGRAVGGVYNKVMNFRALDPTDDRKGFDGGAEVDADVWNRFFDWTISAINRASLNKELARLGLDLGNSAMPATGQARSTIVATTGSLDLLLKKYETAIAQGIFDELPVTSPVVTHPFFRNPLVVPIVQLRAGRKCEIPNCSTPTFQNDAGDDFCEVHHVVPLSEGGKDTIENAICLCPVHHREAHHGKHRAELRKSMQQVRMNMHPPQ